MIMLDVDLTYEIVPDLASRSPRTHGAPGGKIPISGPPVAGRTGPNKVFRVPHSEFSTPPTTSAPPLCPPAMLGSGPSSFPHQLCEGQSSRGQGESLTAKFK